MPSISFGKFEERANEALELVNRTGSDSITYKAYIVLLSAAWEIFVELLVKEAATFVADKSADSTQIPIELKRRICNTNLHSDGRQKHDHFAWLFAGEHWREQVLQYAVRQVEILNTPNTAKINELFDRALNLSNISSHWGRQGMGHVKAADTLDEWLEIRHSIAHGAREDPLIKSDVWRFKNFLEVTVKKTDNKVSNHIETMIGLKPW